MGLSKVLSPAFSDYTGPAAGPQIPIRLLFGHLKDSYALNVFLTVASILLILKLNNGNGIFKESYT